jgi:hypothetical protein
MARIVDGIDAMGWISNLTEISATDRLSMSLPAGSWGPTFAQSDDSVVIVSGHELHKLPRIFAFDSRRFVQFVTEAI